MNLRYPSDLDEYRRGCSAARVMTIQPYIVVKQVVTAPLPNARQKMWVSRVLADDHYKRMPRVAVGVAR